MARNEEKQLARLNRFYLQQQKEEEHKKRPPRPKLESLTTYEEIKKWLPSITRDISFYVKQMEVPCYQDKQIEEFEQRIGHLKGEYKAFLRKLRELNPEEKLIPWTDRPYATKRLKVLLNQENSGSKEKDEGADDCDKGPSPTQSPASFIPLSTPVLNNDEQHIYNFGYIKPVVASCPDLSDESMNEPLNFQFATSMKALTYNEINSRSKCEPQVLINDTTLCEDNQKTSDDKFSEPNVEARYTFNCSESHNTSGMLNLPYSDSSSSDDET